MSTPLLNNSMMLAYLAASFVLAATPGPGVLFIVTRTVSQGRLAGLASVGGVALGNFGNAVGASLGLAALFAVSSIAFAAVKLLGACYLVYLGISSLRMGNAANVNTNAPKLQATRILRDGFWVALLNPKTAIFFAAFLPQFLDMSAPTTSQSIGLGATFVFIAACTDTAYVLAAAQVSQTLHRSTAVTAFGRYLTATIFVSLGIFTALTESRSST